MFDSRKYTFENLFGIFGRIYFFRMWFDELFEYWIHCTQNAPHLSEVSLAFDLIPIKGNDIQSFKVS